jgi:DNA-binding beta-propeller fold protein YncE
MKMTGYVKYMMLCSLTGCFFVSTVQAQPQVDLQFESMFGQYGFFENGTPPNGFSSPTGVTFNNNSEIMVADRGNGQVQRCDLQGTCIWMGLFAFQFKNQPGTFDLPHGIESDRNGKYAVADEDNHAVQLCNLSQECEYKGEQNSENNPPQSGFGRWAFPGDVAFDSQRRVYGLDTGNNRVQILKDGSLDFAGQFGGSGTGLGQFNEPKGISIDSSDTVYIADTGNNRIQICDKEGDNCTAFGSLGTAAGQFNEPKGIEVDSRGLIWVADTGNHRIQVCDKQGACAVFGGFGTGEGEFDRPSDVAVSASGRLAVVDTTNNRIQFFSTGPFEMNTGLNDAWYDPETDGQGFFITVFPDLGTVLLAWFTYDTELPADDAKANLGDAGHRWMVALGPIDGNRAVLDIDSPYDGLFDTSRPIEHKPDGTITLTFEDCNTGTVEYDILSINQQGTVPIQRVANDNIALCEALSTP